MLKNVASNDLQPTNGAGTDHSISRYWLKSSGQQGK